MKKIIIDTNALMAMAEYRVDVIEETNKTLDFPHQFCILQGTIVELHQLLKHEKGKFRRAAKLALSILRAKSKKIKIIKEQGNVDDLLAEQSETGNLILTQDIELKKRLTKPYLTIRQKKKVIIVK